MHKVLLLGAGKIGSLISTLLATTGDYEVHIASLEAQQLQNLRDRLRPHPVTIFELDANNEQALDALMAKNSYQAVISGLPYYCNPTVADMAVKHGTAYFDLTEDVDVTQHVQKISQGKQQVFMPQCGLAPGFISIAANALMQDFDELNMVKMRVGALPTNPNNTLKYSLTWSTDGLINEYGNTCYGIEDGKLTALQPLEGYETITLDGVLYEAFNTSGGLGTLAQSYDGRITSLNYKTMRYPGHCDIIKLLMNELKLNDDRDTLKRIFENAIPKTPQDVVLIYVAVNGAINGEFIEKNYLRKVYPQTIAGSDWSSIQVTTASGICAVIDIVLNSPGRFSGFTTQERIPLTEFLANRFGQYYEKGDRRCGPVPTNLTD